MNEAKVFVLFADLKEKIEGLTREDKGALFEAILAYLNDEEIPSDLPYGARVAFGFIRPMIDNGAEKSKSRSRAAMKRWDANGTDAMQNGADESKAMQTDANGCKTMQTDANGMQSDANVCSIKNKKQETRNKNNNTSSCAEPVSAPAPEEPPVITMPLNDGTEYAISEGDVTAWVALYPAVDVEQELRNMRGWLLDNPTKRKTVRGIRQFIGGWLRREQDRPHPSAPPARGAPGISPVKAGITSGTDFDKMAADTVLSLIG